MLFNNTGNYLSVFSLQQSRTHMFLQFDVVFHSLGSRCTLFLYLEYTRAKHIMTPANQVITRKAKVLKAKQLKSRIVLFNFITCEHRYVNVFVHQPKNPTGLVN